MRTGFVLLVEVTERDNNKMKKISDIKNKGLRLLAEMRLKQTNPNTDKSKAKVIDIIWSDTKEGINFWFEVHDGERTILNK